MLKWVTTKKLRHLKDKQVNEAMLKKHRDLLVAYMEQNPLQVDAPKRFVFMVHAWKPMMAGFLVLVVLSGTGGVVYASQGSVPGDTLYTMKIASEDMRERLTLSSEKKMQYKAVRAEKRLAEVEKILQRIKVPETRHVRMQFAMEKYEDHLAKMESIAEDLSEKGHEVAGDRMLVIIDRIVEKHDEVIASASASDEVSEELIVLPVKLPLDLEDRFEKMVEEKKLLLKEHEETRRSTMRKKRERMRAEYEKYQERRRKLLRERDDRDDDDDVPRVMRIRETVKTP